jgi:histidine triad (HIT) family protein
VDCVFCDIISGKLPASVVAREPQAMAFLDARPLFKGHVLVVPSLHVETLPELQEVTPLFSLAQRIAGALPPALGAQGTFVALNNVVSQSVPHLHVHVVPRTKGDGLKGFFWPRTKYSSDEERDSYAAKITSALGRSR